MNPPEEEIAFIRQYKEPEPPEQQTERQTAYKPWLPRFVTYCVFASAAFWLVGIYILHLHPSKTTFAGSLILLMLYSGQSLRRHRPSTRREPGRHIQTHSHSVLTKSDSGFKWIER